MCHRQLRDWFEYQVLGLLDVPQSALLQWQPLEDNGANAIAAAYKLPEHLPSSRLLLSLRSCGL